MPTWEPPPFRLYATPLPVADLRVALQRPDAGGFASFEGWVRDHHEGRGVLRLTYEAYAPLAEREGARILAEAHERWPVLAATAAHRTGTLEVGEIAVWVGVAAAHRDAAFAACRYVIDEIKARVAIWKQEHYASGDTTWREG